MFPALELARRDLLHLANVVCMRTQQAEVLDRYVNASPGNAAALVSPLQDSLRNVGEGKIYSYIIHTLAI